jgi:hypothetical protein
MENSRFSESYLNYFMIVFWLLITVCFSVLWYMTRNPFVGIGALMTFFVFVHSMVKLAFSQEYFFSDKRSGK